MSKVQTSATGVGTPSPKTSFMNDCLVMQPLRVETLLNASLSRLSSASVTVIKQVMPQHV
jgi:hypothetical protein